MMSYTAPETSPTKTNGWTRNETNTHRHTHIRIHRQTEGEKGKDGCTGSKAI